MDISKFELKETADIHLRNPIDGELLYDDDGETPVSVTVYGVGSKADRRERSRIDGKMKKATEEEREAAFLGAVTVSFNGFEYPGSPEELYADPAFVWLRDQVAMGRKVYANFLDK